MSPDQPQKLQQIKPSHMHVSLVITPNDDGLCTFTIFRMTMDKNKIAICDECRSEYYSTTSKMNNLCPECSHILYGYQNCEHQFKNDRCEKCYWNGSSSEFLKSLKGD